MSSASPALRRVGFSIAAGVVAGGLVALQELAGWPTLRTAAVVLSPVSLVVATARSGVLGAVVSLGVAALVARATSAVDGVPMWAVIGGYGAVVAYVFFVVRHTAAVNWLMLTGVGLSVGLALVHLQVRAQHQGRSLAQEYAVIVQEADAELQANTPFAELDDAQREQALAAVPWLLRLLPLVAVGEALTTLALSTWVCIWVLRRLGLRSVARLDFGAWRLPEWFVFCFIVPASGLLYGLWREHATLSTVAANVLVGVLCVYFAHGCAILHAFLRRVGTRPVMEALVFGSILLLQPLPFLLAVAGLFDFLVDFRGRWMPASSAPDERPEG